MPLKKKIAKKGSLEKELENQKGLQEVLAKIDKEKEWEGVGNSMKDHKEKMNKIWAKEKKKKEASTYKPMKVGEVRSNTTHDESGEVIVKKHKSWKEHNAWLDTFRAKIITGKGDK